MKKSLSATNSPCSTSALRLLFLVDHLARHAAVDGDIGAGDEARALGVDEPGYGLGDILRLADPAHGMLRMILAAQRAVILGRNPAGTDAIDAHIWPEADGERVG